MRWSEALPSGHHAFVAEYLIRTANGEWPAVHATRLSAVLQPAAGYACKQIEAGWGDFRMSCDDATVAFSGEMYGWQVVIEGRISDDAADRFIEIVTKQIETEVGEACEWVRYD
jgi:hypothetical protein